MYSGFFSYTLLATTGYLSDAEIHLWRYSETGEYLSADLGISVYVVKVKQIVDQQALLFSSEEASIHTVTS